MHIEAPWYPGIEPIETKPLAPLVVFQKMETVWVLSSVNNLVNTADIIVFGHHPTESEVMEFIGCMEEFLSYKEVKDKSEILRFEGSLSTVCRFYELSKTEVK